MKITRGSVLTENQVSKLWNILDGDGKIENATDNQKNYLIRLGYDGDVDALTKEEASNHIQRLKGKFN